MAIDGSQTAIEARDGAPRLVLVRRRGPVAAAGGPPPLLTHADLPSPMQVFVSSIYLPGSHVSMWH